VDLDFRFVFLCVVQNFNFKMDLAQYYARTLRLFVYPRKENKCLSKWCKSFALKHKQKTDICLFVFFFLVSTVFKNGVEEGNNEKGVHPTTC